MAIAVLVFAASAIGDGELDGDLVAEEEPRLEETDGELELGWRHGTGCGGLGDMVVPHRPDAGEEYGIADLLLFDRLLDPRQQVGLTLEPQDDDALELTRYRVGLGHLVAVWFGIIPRRCRVGQLDSALLRRGQYRGRRKNQKHRQETLH